MTMDTLKLRTQVLQEHGATEAEVQELLSYNENEFRHGSDSLDQLSLPDEPHIAVWQEYVEQAQIQGVLPTLASYLVQLQFPIESGISQTPEYRAATRKGQFPSQSSPGVKLEAPEALQLFLHPTLAGSIPVIATGTRADFVSLIQALTKRNEPVPIPDAMGACIIGGYNNWDRVHRYRQQWEAQHPNATEQDWLQEFSNLIPQKERYQDRFIILSPGPYSNLQATDLGLSESQWQAFSFRIRLEHECTHYFTRRCFQSMRNNALDELIADYQGIVGAIGYYRANWFLSFVGLEAFPAYREGGRLESYRGDPPLSAGAFRVLQSLVKSASEQIEKFDQTYLSSERSPEERLAMLLSLTTLTLEELASEDSYSFLENSMQIHTAKVRGAF